MLTLKPIKQDIVPLRYQVALKRSDLEALLAEMGQSLVSLPQRTPADLYNDYPHLVGLVLAILKQSNLVEFEYDPDTLKADFIGLVTNLRKEVA